MYKRGKVVLYWLPAVNTKYRYINYQNFTLYPLPVLALELILVFRRSSTQVNIVIKLLLFTGPTFIFPTSQHHLPSFIAEADV